MGNKEYICFIDFETSGVDVFRDEPIEIGAILIDDHFNVIKKFSSRIKVERNVYLKQSAYKIHNISQLDLLNAPTQKEVLNNYFELFGIEYRFAGWNINFDVSFFRKLCSKNGFMVKYNKINHRHLDIQSINFLANQLNLFPKKLNSLSELLNYFDIYRNQEHSAEQDALLTLEVYKKLMILFKSNLTIQY